PAPAGGLAAAAGPTSGGPAAAATPGAARTVPLPLAPWAPAADKPGAAAPSPHPAPPGAPGGPARLDGPGSGTAAAAVEEGASSGAATDAPAPAPAHELDTAAAKQIETLRKGITKALQGAREILALLDSRSPR